MVSITKKQKEESGTSWTSSINWAFQLFSDHLGHCPLQHEPGFYHVGRGSGANSIVAYCLKITDVDPIKLNLYFERFLNPRRTSPPDFDIDFSWKDRDDVQVIFQTLRERSHALLGATATFRDVPFIANSERYSACPKKKSICWFIHR
jgi:hypothetical protein